MLHVIYTDVIYMYTLSYGPQTIICKDSSFTLYIIIMYMCVYMSGLQYVYKYYYLIERYRVPRMRQVALQVGIEFNNVQYIFIYNKISNPCFLVCLFALIWTT